MDRACILPTHCQCFFYTPFNHPRVDSLFVHLRSANWPPPIIENLAIHILDTVKRELEAYDSLYSRWTASCLYGTLSLKADNPITELHNSGIFSVSCLAFFPVLEKLLWTFNKEPFMLPFFHFSGSRHVIDMCRDGRVCILRKTNVSPKLASELIENSNY